jgi:rubrerythrin
MDFKNLKEIVDFAIDSEKEAAEFYETASREEGLSGSKQMLLEFAEQERKHQELLEKFKREGLGDSLKNYEFEWITDIKRSDYVDDVEYKPGMAYHEILLLATKREEKALKLYNELLRQADSGDAKLLFKMLCQEEAKHKLALETMYDDYMAEMGD